MLKGIMSSFLALLSPPSTRQRARARKLRWSIPLQLVRGLVWPIDVRNVTESSFDMRAGAFSDTLINMKYAFAAFCFKICTTVCAAFLNECHNHFMLLMNAFPDW